MMKAQKRLRCLPRTMYSKTDTQVYFMAGISFVTKLSFQRFYYLFARKTV